MENIDWSKAPEGATHYSPMCGDWYKVSGVSADCWSNSQGGWYPAHIWKLRKDYCITRPQPVEWNSQCLPPVGTDIEFKSVGGQWVEGQYIGQFNGLIVAGCHQTKAVGYLESGEFRPIRTPEQIAADEREDAIKEIESLICCDYLGVSATARILYDAGYRKP